MANGSSPRSETPGPLAARARSASPVVGRDRSSRDDDRFFKVFQASPVAIILRTLCEGRVVDVNASYTELVGFRRAELIGRTVHELGLWVDPSQGERVLDRLRRKGVVRNVEGRFRRKSGDIRDVLIWGELTEIRGETVVIGMIVDITERKLMETELRRSREQLRSLSAHLQQIREEERIRIARELHDELGQALTSLKMDLEEIFSELAPEQQGAIRRAQAMRALLDGTVRSVRRIATELRPLMLDDLGLVSTVEWLAHDFSERTGIVVTLDLPGPELVVGADLSTALFRVLQESLTNVARHAGASRVEVMLEQSDCEIRLHVRDNGKGIDLAAGGRNRTFGLIGMRERASILGGQVLIEGQPGVGTSVVMIVPVLRAAPDVQA